MLTTSCRRDCRAPGAPAGGVLRGGPPGNTAQHLEGTDASGLDTDRERLVRLFPPARPVFLAPYGGGWLRAPGEVAPCRARPTWWPPYAVSAATTSG